MPRYIDADAFIALYEEMAKDDWNKRAAPISWSQAFESTIEDVEEMPTADVEPVRHGRWIEHPDDIFPLESTIECSVCGEQENVDIHNDNFCPNCGAKMDGGEIVEE